MFTRKTSAIILAASALFLAPVTPARAAVFTYSETISDSNNLLNCVPMIVSCDLLDLGRDLSRTRKLGDGTVLVENDDAVIASENSVSDTWGVSTFLPFALNHIFVADPVTSFISATLTLEVYGAEASLGDLVFVDFPFPLGVLNANGDNAPSTTTLTSDIIGDQDLVNFLLGLMLTDKTVMVGVLPLLFDVMSIHSSTLTVTYEGPVPQGVEVPEPVSGLLMLTSLFALGGRSVMRMRRG